jgi:hypothetical protein
MAEKTKLPKDLVPKFYAMDPDVEDLLPGSNHLANGMKVLIEPNNLRASEADMQYDWGIERALERNRWCTVTHLFWNEPNQTYEFIAVYDDGTKRVRLCHRNQTWLVKLASVHAAMVEESERYSQVYAFVTEAMKDTISAWKAVDHYDLRSDHLATRAEEITRKILGLL